MMNRNTTRSLPSSSLLLLGLSTPLCYLDDWRIYSSTIFSHVNLKKKQKQNCSWENLFPIWQWLILGIVFVNLNSRMDGRVKKKLKSNFFFHLYHLQISDLGQPIYIISITKRCFFLLYLFFQFVNLEHI